MRPIDFLVYYCMQTFKTGNLNFNTPLGRACGLASFVVGSLVLTIIVFILYLTTGYIIMDHYIAFMVTFLTGYVLSNTLVYYIYRNRKRYQYIMSPHYKPFKYTNTTGLAISVAAFVLSIISIFTVVFFIEA